MNVEHRGGGERPGHDHAPASLADQRTATLARSRGSHAALVDRERRQPAAVGRSSRSRRAPSRRLDERVVLARRPGTSSSTSAASSPASRRRRRIRHERDARADDPYRPDTLGAPEPARRLADAARPNAWRSASSSRARPPSRRVGHGHVKSTCPLRVLPTRRQALASARCPATPVARARRSAERPGTRTRATNRKMSRYAAPPSRRRQCPRRRSTHGRDRPRRGRLVKDHRQRIARIEARANASNGAAGNPKQPRGRRRQTGRRDEPVGRRRRRAAARAQAWTGSARGGGRGRVARGGTSRGCAQLDVMTDPANAAVGAGGRRPSRPRVGGGGRVRTRDRRGRAYVLRPRRPRRRPDAVGRHVEVHHARAVPA